MTIEDAVRASLAETVEEVTSPEPDIVSLMARGDRTRRRRVAAWLAGVLVAGAVGVGVSTRAGDDRGQRAPAPTSRVTTEPPPPVVVPQPVGSFTVLSTGVVHVEANEPFSIVWEGWQHEHQVLGRRPWHLGGRGHDRAEVRGRGGPGAVHGEL